MKPAERWQTTGARLDFELPPSLLAELVSACAEPHRAYHMLQHLSESAEWACRALEGPAPERVEQLGADWSSLERFEPNPDRPVERGSDCIGSRP